MRYILSLRIPNENGGNGLTEKLLKVLFPTDRHHMTGLHEIIGGLLPQTGRVLDLGCGANTTLSAYRTSGREVWGTDVAPKPQLRHAEWFRPLGPGGSIPFADASFDLIVAVMVMEHVAEPAPFFVEVARALRPGGHFVGHTISGSHYVTWIRRLLGILPHSLNQLLVRTLYGRPKEDTFPAFYRLNRRAQIVRACRQAGLGEPAIARYADPGYFRFLGPVQEAAIVADWALERIAQGWGRLYMTVTTRK